MHNKKILILLICITSPLLLFGCTSYQALNAMKGDFVRASLNTVPAKVTNAWDLGSTIIICIERTDEKREDYRGDAVKISHPFFSRNRGVGDEKSDRQEYEFLDNTMIYEADSIGMIGCIDFNAEKIPVFSLDEMKQNDFISKHSNAVYYQLKNNRIATLGYLSSEKMFNQYHNFNIDLTNAKVIVGRSGGNPLAAIFLPVTVVVDAVVGTVTFGSTAAACAMVGGCR